MDLHPNLTPVAELVGTWRGPGRGEYPTIEPFEYTEELTFTNVGKPFLVYLQRTWSPAGAPMHMESGFLRVPSPDVVEFTIAQPTGQSELAEGRITGSGADFTLNLRSQILNSGTAKHVEETERNYRRSGDTITVDFSMAAVGEPMTHHLSSTLRRT
ncbi:MAG: FABP family protein [Rhodococcus sp.]|nr:FABP family protein [Rhodococcus sp. (in: high G+C Gram-positive bacteria)]